MECNKEDAIKAKELAVKKMENKDFAGARKFAFKSQRLYPDLENIGQIISVCDVHCSAENKKVGNEKDWYEILKVEQSADETSIKKQYRKLALLLHPDKNKFSGAEDAFMLIGEAQKVLLDKEKRLSYDVRYRRFCQNTALNPQPQDNRNSKNAKPPSGQNNITRNGSSNVKNQTQQQADPAGVSGGAESFLTVCPFCAGRYRCRMIALNKNLQCQSCKKEFIAFDMCMKTNPPGSSAKQTNSSSQAGVSKGVGSSKGKFQANSGQQPSGSNANQAATGNGRSQENPGEKKSGVNPSAKSRPSTQAGTPKKTNQLNKGAKNKAGSGAFNHPRTTNGKKDKKQPDVKNAGDTSGKREKKQASAEKEGDSVGKRAKKQSSADKEGDSVVKRAKKEGVDSFAKSGGSFQSKGSKGTAVEKEGGASAGSRRGGDLNSKQSSESKGSKGTAVEKQGGASAGSRCRGDLNSKQSSESKKRVSDTEIGSGDETLNSSKRFKGNAQSPSSSKKTPPKVGSTNFKKAPDLADEINQSEAGKSNENHCLKEADLQRRCEVEDSDTSLDASLKLGTAVPDTDFTDFDQIRKESNFKVNQIWAAYDTVDAMPRFYAHIKRVDRSGFKLRITWLEPAPDKKDELSWANNDLPFSCGKFILGNSETTEDILMFSQPMLWEKGNMKGSFKIYPKKGETWALFADWHRGWLSNPQDNSSNYKFEFVEVLSDYDERTGINVAVLGKLKGFSCLFCRRGRDEMHIPANDYLKFSHRVPSSRMTGQEGEGVPKGSLELDTASLPLNIEEISLPEEMKVQDEKPSVKVKEKELKIQNDQMEATSVFMEKEPEIQNDQMETTSVVMEKEPEIQNDQMETTSNDIADHLTTESSSLDPCELPETEFFDFDATRDLGRFAVGQVWALYSDSDGLPKYYAQIKKVSPTSEQKLKISWLEPPSRSNELIWWKNKKMPVCCGRFSIRKPNLQPYLDSAPFSHQLQVETIKLNVYEIYPRRGEIWALYKNWNVDMTPSDIENCDYDVVEITEGSINRSNTKVRVLERVPGYNCVFKAKMDGTSFSTMEIPFNELLRFSHQIPSHELIEQKGGILKGFKELDPSALPPSFFLPKVR